MYITIAAEKNRNKKCCGTKNKNKQKTILNNVIKCYADKLNACKRDVFQGTIKLHVFSILRVLKVTGRTAAVMPAGKFTKLAADYS